LIREKAPNGRRKQVATAGFGLAEHRFPVETAVSKMHGVDLQAQLICFGFGKYFRLLFGIFLDGFGEFS
jgi:hypothetical protein